MPAVLPDTLSIYFVTRHAMLIRADTCHDFAASFIRLYFRYFSDDAIIFFFPSLDAPLIFMLLALLLIAAAFVTLHFLRHFASPYFVSPIYAASALF